MKKTLLLAATAFGVAFSAFVLVPMEEAKAEVVYPWCVRYRDKDGTENCGFTSYAQCMGTARGNTGYCYRNPQYVDGPRYQRRGYPRRGVIIEEY